MKGRGFGSAIAQEVPVLYQQLKQLFPADKLEYLLVFKNGALPSTRGTSSLDYLKFKVAVFNILRADRASS